MKLRYAALLLFSCVTPFASACEGECIVGITKAFIGNYTDGPVHEVLSLLANQVSQKMLPPSAQLADPIVLMQPIFTCYANASYDSMATAIFPSYFHGKCQRFSKDGQDPPGCPNPDCPVVCGTPGSLVHFYSTLRYIAFNDTKSVLDDCIKPGSKPYTEVEDQIKNARSSNGRALSPRFAYSSDVSLTRYGYRNHSKSTLDVNSKVVAGHVHPRSSDIHRLRSNRHGYFSKHLRTDLDSDLTAILNEVGSLLASACGGSVDDGTGGLPQCSWETDMKAYILSFP